MNRKQLIGLLALLLALPPMAMQAQRLTGYEYWFDGKVGDRVSRSLSGYEAEIETDIATQHLSSGLHTLYMRFKQSGGEYEYSPVTSQIFFKHNAEEGGLVEYWFDDDIKNCATVILPSEATENMIDVALDMTDAIKFPLGFHRLNIRVSTEGKSLSNIYTAHVLKVPSGNMDIIEYWVDDDFENRQTIEGKVASTDEHAYVFNDSFNLSGMPSGPHRIYYRPTNKNGTASGAVSMSSVIVGGGTPSKIEYWFDDDVAHSAAVDLPASAMNDTIDVALLMNNSEKFPLGMHQLSMRMVSKDREQSPIYSARVLKMASGKIDVIEYWVDDNYQEGKNRTVTGNVASNDENAYVFVNSFDLSDVPAGLHHVYYRATNAERNANSAVSMATVTIGGGNINKLEYWFDGNSDKRYTVTGSVNESSKECNFDKALNLAEVSEGIHRMYYRGINGSGATRSAVSMTPVVVKSRYNVENREALTVTEQAYWFDNEEPEVRIVNDPKNIRDLPLTLDARKLSDGKHTLHLQYGNSAGIWNGPVDFTFTKTKVETPSITANASLKEGIVTLKFTTVPYGQGYDVVRQYPSGTVRRVEPLIKNTEYPATLISIDKPAPGNYIYYVEGHYLDADGVPQKVRSGEMNVTIEKAAEEVKRGSIHGEVKIDGRAYNGSYDVTINGKRATSHEDYKFSYSSFGTFFISNIPYNTEVTIGIKVDNYKYKDITLIVNENTTNGTIQFNGTWTGEKEEILPEDDNYDLALSDKIHITDNGWEIPIHNLSSKIWSGNLIVKVIRKNFKQKFDKDYSNEVYSPLDFMYYNCYTTIADMPVNIKGCRDGRQVVLLEIKDMPDADKNEDYYVYVFSKKNDLEDMKMLKPSYEGLNPQIQTFNPVDYKKKVMSVMDECVDVMKVVKQFAQWGDPFKLAWKSLEDAGNNFIDNYDPKGDDKLIEAKFNATMKSAGLLWSCFYDEVNQKIISKHLTETKLYNATDKITELYNTIRPYLDESQSGSQKDNGRMFFKLARLVLKYADKGDPVTKIYTTYFEVGEAMIKAIENMTYGIHHDNVWDRLVTGNAEYKMKIRKDTDKGLEYFAGKDYYGQINSITITLKDPDNGELIKNVNEDNIELKDDGIIIKNLKFDIAGIGYKDVEAWMTIAWENNRVTHVPLLNEDFVKIENLDTNVKDALIMTVELQSGTYYEENRKSIPNHLTFVKPHKSWLE